MSEIAERAAREIQSSCLGVDDEMGIVIFEFEKAKAIVERAIAESQAPKPKVSLHHPDCELPKDHDGNCKGEFTWLGDGEPSPPPTKAVTAMIPTGATICNGGNDLTIGHVNADAADTGTSFSAANRLFGRAMILLKGLNLAVKWELAPEIKQEIASICAEFESGAAQEVSPPSPEPWKSLRVIDGQKYVLLSEVGEATIKRIAATMKAEGDTRELKAAANKLVDYCIAHDWGMMPEPYDSINPLLKLLGRFTERK